MDDELPRDDAADQHKPPINLSGSRQSGEGVTDADLSTGRADRKDRILPRSSRTGSKSMDEPQQIPEHHELQADDEMSRTPRDGSGLTRRHNMPGPEAIDASGRDERTPNPPPQAISN